MTPAGDRPTGWSGILSPPLDGEFPGQVGYPEVEATPGLRVEHRASGFGGVVVRREGNGVVVRSPSGRERLLEPRPGSFSVDGYAVTLVLPPKEAAAAGAGASVGRTASGSIAATPAGARVARPSRILVEGLHDAELVERIWGDDLRHEGVVVERLDGLDNLPAYVKTFDPEPGRRLGVLCDHLVDGSKEDRIAAEVASPHVLVRGHPFVDVWQAVRPGVIGLDAWPEIPRGRPWKESLCEELGFEDPRSLWRTLLSRVRDWGDLETPLVTAVEELIDFVTAGDH